MTAWPIFRPWLIAGLEQDFGTDMIACVRQYEASATLGIGLKGYDTDTTGRVLIARFNRPSWICSYPEWDIPFLDEMFEAQKAADIGGKPAISFFESRVSEIPIGAYDATLRHVFTMNSREWSDYRWFRIASDELTFDVITDGPPMTKLVDISTEGELRAIRRRVFDAVYEADETWTRDQAS
jgi:hypothetical protein